MIIHQKFSIIAVRTLWSILMESPNASSPKNTDMDEIAMALLASPVANSCSFERTFPPINTVIKMAISMIPIPVKGRSRYAIHTDTDGKADDQYRAPREYFVFLHK